MRFWRWRSSKAIPLLSGMLVFTVIMSFEFLKSVHRWREQRGMGCGKHRQSFQFSLSIRSFCRINHCFHFCKSLLKLQNHKVDFNNFATDFMNFCSREICSPYLLDVSSTMNLCLKTYSNNKRTFIKYFSKRWFITCSFFPILNIMTLWD